MRHVVGRAVTVVGGALLIGVGCSSSDTSSGAVPADSGADVDYGDGPTTFRPDSDVPPDTRAETAGDGGAVDGDGATEPSTDADGAVRDADADADADAAASSDADTGEGG